MAKYINPYTDFGFKQATETAQNEGLQKGLVEGLKKGREEAKLEIAKTMKNDGASVAFIAKYTGLSEEEITLL